MWNLFEEKTKNFHIICLWDALNNGVILYSDNLF